MSIDLSQPLISTSFQFVDPQTGVLTKQGMYFQLSMLNRTGGPQGESIDSVKAIAEAALAEAEASLKKAANLSDLTNVVTARSNLGLGTAATQNTGTSGATIPLLNGDNIYSGSSNFTGTFQKSGTTQTFPGSGLIVGTTDAQTLTNKTLTSPTINGGTGNGPTLNNAVAGTPFRFHGYTVATLPAGTVGDTAYVTDAMAPAFLTTLVGGGAVTSPAFYDNTNWVAV